MTPEQLDEARAKETLRRLVDSGKVYCHEDIAALGARLAREGWTPPEPDPVDPDVLAFREWAATDYEADAWTGGALLCRLGRHDDTEEARAFLAGARMATERERERAGPFVDYVKERALHPEGAGARAILAKYRGEA